MRKYEADNLATIKSIYDRTCDRCGSHDWHYEARRCGSDGAQIRVYCECTASMPVTRDEKAKVLYAYVKKYGHVPHLTDAIPVSKRGKEYI